MNVRTRRAIVPQQAMHAHGGQEVTARCRDRALLVVRCECAGSSIRAAALLRKEEPAVQSLCRAALVGNIPGIIFSGYPAPFLAPALLNRLAVGSLGGAPAAGVVLLAASLVLVDRGFGSHRLRRWRSYAGPHPRRTLARAPARGWAVVAGVSRRWARVARVAFTARTRRGCSRRGHPDRRSGEVRGRLTWRSAIVRCLGRWLILEQRRLRCARGAPEASCCGFASSSGAYCSP
jgi:hypothetical protein